MNQKHKWDNHLERKTFQIDLEYISPPLAIFCDAYYLKKSTSGTCVCVLALAPVDPHFHAAGALAILVTLGHHASTLDRCQQPGEGEEPVFAAAANQAAPCPSEQFPWPGLMPARAFLLLAVLTVRQWFNECNEANKLNGRSGPSTPPAGKTCTSV